MAVGVAAERDTPWERFLRHLGAPIVVRFTARVIAALAFALAATLPVAISAVLFGNVHLGAGDWVRVGAALLAGSIPFGLLGVALGYLVDARGAVPIANLLYLSLAWAGGLFGTKPFSGTLADVAGALPTRLWNDLVHAAVGGHAVHRSAVGLAAYTLLFLAVAAWGYRRDEGRCYR